MYLPLHFKQPLSLTLSLIYDILSMSNQEPESKVSQQLQIVHLCCQWYFTYFSLSSIVLKKKTDIGKLSSNWVFSFYNEFFMVLSDYIDSWNSLEQCCTSALENHFERGIIPKEVMHNHTSWSTELEDLKPDLVYGSIF